MPLRAEVFRVANVSHMRRWLARATTAMLAACAGGGKHSLKQLVQNVQSQRDAYEDTFARNKTNRKAAASRYGW